MTEPTYTNSASRELARALCVAAVLSCFATSLTRAQAVAPASPTPAQLAKYDVNKNGVIDPAEQAAIDAELAGVVQLSPFTVAGDSDVGWVARDSLAGTRLNTALKDTAASISVMTKEFMDDIGATSVADAMAWSTNTQLTNGDVLSLASGSDDVNSTFFNFDSFRIRGIGATQTKNYFDWALPSDTYNSDRIEEARGPNSILFGIGSAGGVVNSSTKRANLQRDTRSATVGISSYGGYRGTIDVNQRFGRKLAVRFNGVYDRTEHSRNFNYSQKQMADLAVTYKLTDTTTIRADYETGRVRDNVGTNQQATDQYTSWANGGSRLIAAPIPTTSNAAFGVSRFGAAVRVTYVGNTDTLMNLANQYASIGSDNVLSPDVVSYDVSVGGPGILRRPHFDNVTVALEHQFGQNTFLELAYNHQQYQTFNQQVNSGIRLFVDPNTTLPTGAANPNAGKYYIESESWAWAYGLRADTTRLSLAHELDAGKWGKYRFAGLGEYSFRSPRNALMFEVWQDHPYAAAPENQANVVIRRQYVTPGDSGSFYYENPVAFGLIKGLTDPITGRTLNSTWIPRNAPNMRDPPEKQKSVLLAAQARYFGDRLVIGAGYRLDKLETLTRGTTKDANGLFVTDYAANTFQNYEGRTKTLGVVYHVTSKISLFYNKSDNFSLPGAVFIVPDGHRTTNPVGKGEDYGIAISLLDGKLYARANAFTTDLANGSNSNYGSTTNNPAIIGDQILDAAIAAGALTAAQADPHRVDGNGSTFDQKVEGYEFSLTANPTRNWHVLTNFSYTDGFVSNVAPEIQAWASKEIPFFKTFNQGLVTPNGTIAQRIASFEDYHNQQLDLQGLALPGNRKFKVKFITNYSFSEGMFKGLRIGGGYRHESKIPIGQYADQSLQYGPSYSEVTGMLGYRFAKSPVPWLKRLSLQLNVANLLDDDDAYILRRTKIAPETPVRLRVREGRTWKLTAMFDF